MKKLPIILSSLSLAGVIVVFILMFARTNGGSKTIEQPASASDMKIAYVQTDSVLVAYELSIDLQEDFHDKQQQYNIEFGQKRSDLERQAVAFQEKLQRGGFLSEERAMKERDRLLGQEEEMKKLDYEYSTKLAEMEAKIQRQLADSIVSYVKEYNKKHGYTYVLSNNGNIILGEPRCNITKDIVEGLNARYAASKKR